MRTKMRGWKGYLSDSGYTVKGTFEKRIGWKANVYMDVVAG